MRLDRSRLSDWACLPFFAADSLKQIDQRLACETRHVLPVACEVFRAFELTQPKAVRVVILGQDPYPTPGHANGLAFSVHPGVPSPLSLRNILTELETDLGVTR